MIFDIIYYVLIGFVTIDIVCFFFVNKGDWTNNMIYIDILALMVLLFGGSSCVEYVYDCVYNYMSGMCVSDTSVIINETTYYRIKL